MDRFLARSCSSSESRTPWSLTPSGKVSACREPVKSQKTPKTKRSTEPPRRPANIAGAPSRWPHQLQHNLLASARCTGGSPQAKQTKTQASEWAGQKFGGEGGEPSAAGFGMATAFSSSFCGKFGAPQRADFVSTASQVASLMGSLISSPLRMPHIPATGTAKPNIFTGTPEGLKPQDQNVT